MTYVIDTTDLPRNSNTINNIIKNVGIRQLYEVTLGFADNEYEDCGPGKRIFDVSVNGAQFLNRLDIAALVGCNQGYVVRGIFPASTSNEITILFSQAEIRSLKPIVSFVLVRPILDEVRRQQYCV